MSLFIAIVWLINGLVCKVLNGVTRHQKIVERILGGNHARLITVMIGASEILMALWILSGIRRRFNAWVQVLVITIMNVLEISFAPDLLLWGRANILFAFLFIILIYWNTFYNYKTSAG